MRIGKNSGSYPAVGKEKLRVVKRRGDTDEEYVLKVLRKQDDAERRQRMYREVQALRLLQHPAIPRVIKSNTDSTPIWEYRCTLW